MGVILTYQNIPTRFEVARRLTSSLRFRIFMTMACDGHTLQDFDRLWADDVRCGLCAPAGSSDVAFKRSREHLEFASEHYFYGDVRPDEIEAIVRDFLPFVREVVSSEAYTCFYNEKQAGTILTSCTPERRPEIEPLLYGNDVVTDDFQDPSLAGKGIDVEFPFKARVIPHRKLRVSEVLLGHAVRATRDAPPYVRREVESWMAGLRHALACGADVLVYGDS